MRIKEAEWLSHSLQELPHYSNSSLPVSSVLSTTFWPYKLETAFPVLLAQAAHAWFACSNLFCPDSGILILPALLLASDCSAACRPLHCGHIYWHFPVTPLPGIQRSHLPSGGTSYSSSPSLEGHGIALSPTSSFGRNLDTALWVPEGTLVWVLPTCIFLFTYKEDKLFHAMMQF